MKLSHTVTLLASVLLCATASAGAITWNNVTPGNMPTPSFNPPTISFMPIGNTTYGSDGSSATSSGNSTADSNGNSSYSTGNITTHSDGARTQIIGDTLYGQRADGSQFYCRRQGDQTVCHPR